MGREIKAVNGSLTAANHAIPLHTPGDWYCDSTTGVTYQYVQHDDGVANAATALGHPAFVKTLASFIVTNDMTSGVTTKANGCVGLYQGVVTDQYYTWIIVLGPTTALHNNDDDAALDDVVIAVDDATFNVIVTGVAITAKPIAIGTAAVIAATNYQAVHVIVGPM